MIATSNLIRGLIFFGVFALVAPVVGAAELAGLKVGETAPDFALKNQDGEMIHLEALRKKGPVALVFYRSADW